MNSWNESGRVWENDHGLLDAEQVAQCERADFAEPLRSPIPTRMISNGENMPVPQTEQQRRWAPTSAQTRRTTSRKSRPRRTSALRGTGGPGSTGVARNKRGRGTL